MDMKNRKEKDMITWTKAALVRAVRTMAQTAVAMIGTALVITDVDWLMVLSASVLAGILSILTSLGGLPEVNATKETEEELSCGLEEDEYWDGEEDE